MRPSYPRAVAWLALHDNCSWAYCTDGTLSVAAQLTAELFGKSPRILAFDLRAKRLAEGIAHGR